MKWGAVAAVGLVWSLAVPVAAWGVVGKYRARRSTCGGSFPCCCIRSGTRRSMLSLWCAHCTNSSGLLALAVDLGSEEAVEMEVAVKAMAVAAAALDKVAAVGAVTAMAAGEGGVGAATAKAEVVPKAWVVLETAAAAATG